MDTGDHLTCGLFNKTIQTCLAQKVYLYSALWLKKKKKATFFPHEEQ